MTDGKSGGYGDGRERVHWVGMDPERPEDLDIALRDGIWGVPDGAEEDIDGVAEGEYLLFFHRDHGLVLCEVTSEPYTEHIPVWPDRDYPHRVRISDPVESDRHTHLGAIADCFQAGGEAITSPARAEAELVGASGEFRPLAEREVRCLVQRLGWSRPAWVPPPEEVPEAEEEDEEKSPEEEDDEEEPPAEEPPVEEPPEEEPPVEEPPEEEDEEPAAEEAEAVPEADEEEGAPEPEEKDEEEPEREVDVGDLERLLFARREVGRCALCGELLPVDLLALVFVKPLEECGPGEPEDLENDVMPACRLGCAGLFEEGYLVVDDEGRVAPGRSDRLTDPVAAYVGTVEGNRCEYWHPGSEDFFRWHAARATGEPGENGADGDVPEDGGE